MSNIQPNIDPNREPFANQWQLRTRSLSFTGLPAIMGIVNVTPDSFSDGGRHNQIDAAVAHAVKLADAGATILDIGGESTRPYSDPVDAEEELNRVVPVIEKIVSRTDTPISIDTSKSIVARAAISAGAEIINDVTGLAGDPEMINVAAQSGAGVCAMHMQGTPQTMQDNPVYENVLAEILGYLKQRLNYLLDAGIDQAKICLDPGIGFGKTHQHNLDLIAGCHQFHQLGCPILIGHSRKGFIAKILDNKTCDRDAATRAITLFLAQKRIQVIRVHEVEETVQALKVFKAIGGIDGVARRV